LRDLLRRRYPKVAQDKFHVIANGYDESDFAGLPSSPDRSSSRLRIVHTGSINPNFRDPRPVFAALRKLIDEGRLRGEEFEMRFVGAGEYGQSDELRRAVASADLAASVKFLPRVSYEESLRELKAADILLLLQASDDTVGLVPAKLYEYFRVGAPVLALVRTGAVSELMAQTGGGWAVDPRAVSALQLAIADPVTAWRAGNLHERSAKLDALRRFDRRALAGELARLFDTVITPPTIARTGIIPHSKQC
jgi:glycosyltransferase involved in cell wall biosynthesis